MKRIKLILAVIFLVAGLILASQLKAQMPQVPYRLPQYPAQRPNLKDQGYGWLINDLERHAHAGHPMRNTSDPGNWAHELCHQIASDIRNTVTPNVDDNAMYIPRKGYFLFKEPNVTLKQVAETVPKSKRVLAYETYMIGQQEWWNDAPFTLLDEGNAFAVSLQYYTTTGKRDAWLNGRVAIATQFLYFHKVLLAAVKKYDPGYPEVGKLEKFMTWHAARVKYLVSIINGVEPTPGPVNPYNILGGCYGLEQRIVTYGRHNHSGFRSGPADSNAFFQTDYPVLRGPGLRYFDGVPRSRPSIR